MLMGGGCWDLQKIITKSFYAEKLWFHLEMVPNLLIFLQKLFAKFPKVPNQPQSLE